MLSSGQSPGAHEQRCAQLPMSPVLAPAEPRATHPSSNDTAHDGSESQPEPPITQLSRQRVPSQLPRQSPRSPPQAAFGGRPVLGASAQSASTRSQNRP